MGIKEAATEAAKEFLPDYEGESPSRAYTELVFDELAGKYGLTDADFTDFEEALHVALHVLLEAEWNSLRAEADERCPKDEETTLPHDEESGYGVGPNGYWDGSIEEVS